MKGKIKLVFKSFAILAIISWGANIYCQIVQFNITSQGQMDGHNGYYRTMTVADSLLQSDFEFNEGEYVRAYAYKMVWDTAFHVLPESTYLARTNNLEIGDSWRSWVFEPVTAVVTDTITLNMPLGNFFTYKTVFTNSAGDTNFIAWGANDVGGVQMTMAGYNGALAEYSIVGGNGYWPLAVGNYWIYSVLTSVDDNSSMWGQSYNVSLANYPNPFNAQTTIKYSLPKETLVSIDIFDTQGRRINSWATENQSAGEHSIVWNAVDVSSGIYFYRIQAGDFVASKRCLLLK